MKNPHRSPSVRPVAWMLAVALWLSAVPTLASAPCGEDVAAGEPPVLQISLGEWRGDLPPGVSLVRVGGGLVNNGFPSVSADGSQIALFYYARHPVESGYPRFEMYSTSTLALLERIEFLSDEEEHAVIQATGQSPNLHDPELLARIEGLLDEVNTRLREGGFRTMETMFRLERDHRLNGVERFGKRVDYPSSATRRALTITSLSTGQVELDIEMPRGVETYRTAPEDLLCGWGGNPRQAWYDPELRILVLQMDFSTSIHGCEQPERWYLKRLGDS